MRDEYIFRYSCIEVKGGVERLICEICGLHAVPSCTVRPTVRAVSKPSVIPDSTHKLTDPLSSVTTCSSLINLISASVDETLAVNGRLATVLYTNHRCPKQCMCYCEVLQ